MTHFLEIHHLEIISCLLMFATTFQGLAIFFLLDFKRDGVFPSSIQILIFFILWASTASVNNKVQTNKINYNLKNYPLGIKGLKTTNLTYVKTEKTLYAEKKKLYFLNENESIVFEVETETISTMNLSNQQTFIVYYKKDGSSRCLYRLDRDWASVDTLLEGSKNYCTSF